MNCFAYFAVLYLDQQLFFWFSFISTSHIRIKFLQRVQLKIKTPRELRMVAFDRPPADIVLVVEGTANLGAYIEDLKQNYILPALTYVAVVYIK